MGNKANQWIKGKFEELRQSRGNKCDICGGKPTKKDPLQFYHIRKTPLSGIAHRGRKERYYDILRHPKSYGLGHRSCHMRKFRRQHANARNK